MNKEKMFKLINSILDSKENVSIAFSDDYETMSLIIDSVNSIMFTPYDKEIVSKDITYTIPMWCIVFASHDDKKHLYGEISIDVEYCDEELNNILDKINNVFVKSEFDRLLAKYSK